jgi:hypothetical protein
MYDNPWIHKGKLFDSENIADYYGFVYRIDCLTNGKSYIGKKLFYSSKSKQVNGKKKRTKVESDWKIYWGSNKVLLEDVKWIGRENFQRTIIHLCLTKGACSYFEAKEQFANDVLLDESFYNSWISCKIAANHIKLDK